MSELEKTPEHALAMAIENAVNKSGFDPKQFAECIKFMHPTLQQSFFRLIRESIIVMADTNRRVDDRNRASWEICREIMDVAATRGVPFI